MANSRYNLHATRGWVIVAVVLQLAALISGHVIQAQERNSEPSTFASTTTETAWMVTGIIFIVLFAVAVIVCIYLWYLRNQKVKEIRHLESLRGDAKDNRNVWYGGAHISESSLSSWDVTLVPMSWAAALATVASDDAFRSFIVSSVSSASLMDLPSEPLAAGSLLGVAGRSLSRLVKLPQATLNLLIFCCVAVRMLVSSSILPEVPCIDSSWRSTSCSAGKRNNVVGYR
uniref:Uncharacterized protein n=1 Tax=Anopheles farauti TaxID=69004 RepID=A0A182Q6R9_9DIPT